jgi:hypothetical protein
VDGVDAMGPTRFFVELMSAHSSIALPFKQKVQGFLFIVANVLAEPFDVYLSLRVILD